MATMLSIAQRIPLPEGAELTLKKEYMKEFRLWLRYRGQEAVVILHKECTPGHAKRLSRASIACGFVTCCMKAGDMKEAKQWQDVLQDTSKNNWPVVNGQLLFPT